MSSIPSSEALDRHVRTAIRDARRLHRKGARFGRHEMTNGVVKVSIEDAALLAQIESTRPPSGASGAKSDPR